MQKIFSNPALLAKYLFIVLAILLIVIAFSSFQRVDGGDINQTIQYASNSFMLFLDAAVMTFFALRITKLNKRIHQLAVIMLIVNLILIVFYDIGLVEILFLLVNAINLFVLIKYRQEFSASN